MKRPYYGLLLAIVVVSSCQRVKDYKDTADYSIQGDTIYIPQRSPLTKKSKQKKHHYIHTVPYSQLQE